MNDNFGAVTRYAYDAEDRVTTITAPWGKDITQSYDFAGRPQRLVYPNGLEADLSFEAQTGRLASVAHAPTSTGNPVLKFDHAYDIRGNLSDFPRQPRPRRNSRPPMAPLRRDTRLRRLKGAKSS